MTNPAGPPLPRTDPGEREYTVVIPTAVTDHTQMIPVQGDEPRRMPSGSAGDTAELPARPDSRWSRFGAALCWIVLGWWLFAAVRLGVALSDVAHVNGSLRRLPAGTLLDLVREATDRGSAELLTAATLAVLAAVVLMASRGRRLLGALSLVTAAGTIVTAVWHLAS